MKIFLDTAHVESIKEAFNTGLLDGVTTNPSSLAKEQQKNATELIRSICKTVESADVSVEVTEESPEAVYKQAKKIAALASNVVVKIPCYKAYIPVIHRLVKEGITVNVTLLFTLAQGLCMAKLGVKYVSPFVGRLDDIDSDGISLIADLREAFDRFGYKTQILAASLRNMRHVHEVTLAGADIATLPVALFNSLTDHPLTERGMELFQKDWKKLGIPEFP